MRMTFCVCWSLTPPTDRFFCSLSFAFLSAFMCHSCHFKYTVLDEINTEIFNSEKKTNMFYRTSLVRSTSS